MRTYFIRRKSWFLVAWFTEKQGNELHWDYRFVKNVEDWESVLREYGWDGNQIYITNLYLWKWKKKNLN